MSAKLKDIAEKLNVSVSTVSRVATGKDKVKPETRAKIQKELDRMRYAPNQVARNLRYSRGSTIGVVVSDISNYFFSNVLQGIEHVARSSGYSIIVCSSDEKKEIEKQNIDTLLQMQISGLIISSLGNAKQTCRLFKKTRVPVVFIDNMPENTKADAVMIDNESAAHALASHVIRSGKRRIAIIGGPLHEKTAVMRIQGFRQAMADHGVAPREEWLHITADSREESGFSSTMQLLALPEPPDTILIVNNLMAFGALKAIRETGLAVPDDVEIACFDFIDYTGILSPLVTSMNQPATRIGETAAEVAIGRIGNEKLAPQVVMMEPELVSRNIRV
jgi:LacI family transcriptional regulator